MQAKTDLAAIRKRHLKEMRKSELDSGVEYFSNLFRKDATTQERTAFDSLVASARRMIEKDTHEFEDYISEIKTKLFSMSWKRDWFVVGLFKHLASQPFLFANKIIFAELKRKGFQAIQDGDMDALRKIVLELQDIKAGGSDIMSDIDITNIVRG